MLNQTLREVRVGALVWKMILDQHAEHLYIQFEDAPYTDIRSSADGDYIAYIRYDPDDIPVIVGLLFTERTRLGVMIDWLHEAAELALAEFDDDFVKGTYRVMEDANGEKILVTAPST